MNFKELKINAKEKLEGKYGDAITVVLIFSIISSLSSLLIGIIYDNNVFKEGISFIITCFFGLGYVSYFYKISKEENVEVNELWKNNNFLSYFTATILYNLFVVIGTILFIIPGIIAALKYSMVYYVILDNPNIDVVEALKESKRIMNGHKMELFKLELSFIGWMILGILTLGILYLWLIPYMRVTIANFYIEIKEQN